MKNLVSSQVLLVRADASIIDCIELMQANNVGSLLVESDDESRALLGIFTERDLLKFTKIIDIGDHWKKPIRTVMTKKVITLKLDEIERAPEVMLKNRIRHIPIVQTTPDGKIQVLAVLSMRDLFEEFVKKIPELTRLSLLNPKPSRKKEIIKSALFSNDFGLRSLLNQVLTAQKNRSVKELSLAKLIELTGSFDEIYLDIDRVDPKLWTKLVLELNSIRKSPPNVYVFFTPGLHSELEANALRLLKENSHLLAYEKPVKIQDFLKRINS